MLSRVAESLYWLSRYIERAEDMTRILAVNFHALLDTPPESTKAGWESIIAITGDATYFHEAFDEDFNPRTVTEFMLWHPDNPDGVLGCITQARENARGVREQISVEMWEHINRLYHFVKDVNRADVLRSPNEFFRQVRDGSQSFQGITDATLSHGEPYEFIQVGKFLERADKTVRIVEVQYADLYKLADSTPAANLQLIAMLKSCSAFEPFRKTYASQMQAWRVAEFLLLNRLFPRAVFFCVERCQQGIAAIAGEQARPIQGLDRAPRTLGRLSAELDYLDIREVLDDKMDPYLNQLLARLNSVDEDITRAYFNTQVVLPGRKPQQAQQQQQQQ
jgi:uncharacterized alpha-E superfamily protein